MAKAGRKPGFVMTHHHRDKIAKSQILNRLIKEAEGKLTDKDKPITPTQATIALSLLKKVMPDLSSVELTGDDDKPVAHEIALKIVDSRD